MFNRFGDVKEKKGTVGRWCARWAHLAVALTFLLAAPLTCGAESDTKSDLRARLADESAPDSSMGEPVELGGGTVLRLHTPKQWKPLAAKISIVLRDTHSEFTTLMGDIPQFETAVHIMESKAFYALTGAPRWTNALFLRGDIILPVAVDEPLDYGNIARSVKHEYTHAVNAALTAGRCPGWIDEGLAQYHEGAENPLLYQALADWLSDNRPVPFRLLLGGFTKLDTEMVPAAYAQSLVASSSIVRMYGYPKLRRYFDGLREGATRTDAFREAFGVSEASFEERLGKTMMRVAREALHAHRHGHHH